MDDQKFNPKYGLVDIIDGVLRFLVIMYTTKPTFSRSVAVSD